MGKVSNWFPPLTGVLFVGFVLAGVLIVGETPDATEDSAQEALDFYADNDDQVFLGSVFWGLGGVFLLFFAGWLRRVLRDAEGAGGILSAVSFGGAIVIAGALATAATFGIAIADVADDIEDPIVVQTLNALSWGYSVPIALGVITFAVASGISVIRHGALPVWLGWLPIVGGILMFTPAFIVGAPLVCLWVLVTSIIRMRRAGPSEASAA